MKTFDFAHATAVDDAVRRGADGGRYYAGGTNLLDLMKLGVESPPLLIDIGRLDLRSITSTAAGGVLIGAGATNSAVANHQLIRRSYPMLAQAILSGATTQIRNMATVGGNLMQRTRCPYFMDATFTQCNKRIAGSGCAARTGFNREHALFGASAACVAVHPSDMAVALAALDARVHVQGTDGRRAIAIADFFLLPGEHPERDNVVCAGELIIGVELPPSPYARHSWYLKVRDRHSYAFALVSVAAGVHLVEGKITAAAVVLGGVAAAPWRVAGAEQQLIGTSPSDTAFGAAADALIAGAEPLAQNGFKIGLARNSVVRALRRATDTLDE
ncbi:MULTISPECIES: FAD binding domain-containing protein [Mycobacteriaceae]|uniref:FAD-binding molybdopterin dehydrogenase n=1 Tax=Mycolicibacterium neoaurum VKM Ac-1815D TaxID=700508 RepID=V5X920_MYCNE|nr:MULTISPECIES: xanthine dehydrogenase family protein subunit M [Mycobacteriaceae]AHC24950.1 molybdopterin dehydrogenase [Mycolicibacterium neoaurum VKM Ac-1815D]AMO05483.1 molybdopterin dehydrogenase [Mycolicibacterium neoaurum]AXK76198.1 xanthine dehydrogenase family protein subunit M [Mycolicibacterium neoaurum]KJQ50673.1 molybdopterin dehydrogenase [Mycolicibacterium neoaurum]KUM09857.1 molybdopterin dehydrogenase [Mycolicibacterium neoaurum]